MKSEPTLDYIPFRDKMKRHVRDENREKERKEIFITKESENMRIRVESLNLTI